MLAMGYGALHTVRKPLKQSVRRSGIHNRPVQCGKRITFVFRLKMEMENQCLS